MKSFLFCICFCIGWINLVGQEIVFNKSFHFRKGSDKIKTIDLVGDISKNTFSFLLASEGNNTILTLDSNFNEIGSAELKNPNYRFKKINGTSVYEGKFYTYFYNANTRVLLAQIFSTRNNLASTFKRQLQLKKREHILNSFSTGESLYLLTLLEQSSTLTLYEFKGKDPVTKQVIELDNTDFPHYLGDNLYNCVNHDILRPHNANLVADFVFADKEDYVTYQNNALYLVSNTNTVIHIDLNSDVYQVSHFPIDFKYQKKGHSIFKNLTKNVRIRSAVLNEKFFRLGEFESQYTLQIFDLKSKSKIFEKVFKSENILKAWMTSDYSKEADLSFEEVSKYISKGALAFRVYEDSGEYKINFGRSVDRLFELYLAYFELSIDIDGDTLSENTSSFNLSGEYNYLRTFKQNLNYEYLEALYKNKEGNLYLIQYDIKNRKLQIID